MHRAQLVKAAVFLWALVVFMPVGANYLGAAMPSSLKLTREARVKVVKWRRSCGGEVDMDALSEVLKILQFNSAIFFNARFTAPWCFASPEAEAVAKQVNAGSSVCSSTISSWTVRAP